MIVASRGITASAVLAALSAGALLAAQSQTPPVFRAEANLVEVIVRVTDSEGRFVPGLTAADFLLDEEGRPQPVVAFNSIDLPRPDARSASSAPVVDATTSSVATNAAMDQSRAFVLLLDDMLTSPQASRSARQAAREFVQQHVGPTDVVAAFSTGGRGVQTQEFTTDKTRVLATINRFIGRRCRTQRMPGFHLPIETESERVYSIRVVMDVMKAIAAHLSGVRGRRVSLVWISEGVDYDPNPYISGTLGSGNSEPDPALVTHVMLEAISALQRANVTLYAIDPRRLYASEQLSPDGEEADVSNPLCREANDRELMRSVDTLREFAQKTGGFAAVHMNEFGDAFARVVDDASRYYVLGYQPASRGRDGEFKRIRVRTKRPGLQVSARAGYVVSSPRPPTLAPPGVSPALASLLTSSLPAAGLPLRLQAIPRRGAEGRGLVYVIVEVPGRELQFTQADGRFLERLEFALVAIDSLARQRSVQPVTMDLSLTAEQVPRVRAAGLRWLTSVDLPAGAYNIRVAARAAGQDRSGSMFLDVEVPAFDNDGFRVNGITLTSLPAALAITAGISPMALGLPTPPTTARAFVQGDVITVAAEIGTRREFTAGAVELTVHEQSAPRETPPLLTRSVELADRATAEHPRAFAIDTTGLGAGQFVLRLAVRDQENRRAETAVLFEVLEPQVQSAPATP